MYRKRFKNVLLENRNVTVSGITMQASVAYEDPIW